MEDRAAIARLAVIGLIGIALVLLALWISRRLFTPSRPVEAPLPGSSSSACTGRAVAEHGPELASAAWPPASSHGRT